jgi:two-component system response regulator ChvI
MGQIDARLGRRPSSIGVLNKIPTVPPRQWDGTLNRRESDRVSPSGPIAPAATKVRRVVLVEGNQYYRETLTCELLRQDFVVHPFADAASLLGSLTTALDADLVVLDWDLANRSGINLLAELRRHGVNPPVVFLTGEFITGENERCNLASPEALDIYESMAFDQGALDFIPKSRDREILVRRLRSRLDFVEPQADLPNQEGLACDKLQLKLETRRAFWNGVDVDLTLGEYKLVHLLASNVGSFVTYRSLYDRLQIQGFVAGSGANGFWANVRSAIKRIRNKFRACDPDFDMIQNYTGFGYGWKKPD